MPQESSWRRLYGRGVSESSSAPTGPDDRAERRAARELVADYHREQLRGLLERVREGFADLDAGRLDEFELDELIHRYKRAAADLWSFCGSSGGQWLQAARSLAHLRERGEEPDWWEASASRRRR